MATTVNKKLVVCGGNGFLGSRICKHAVSRGWKVTSISRSGEPSWSAVTSSPEPPTWSKSVSWQKADILKPTTYQPMIKDADYVVHSMGILLEADYKGVLQGKESIVSGLQRAFSATKGGSQNPLNQEPGSSLQPQEKDGQLTYELMNRDSAIALAREAAAANVGSFAYISAAAGAPVLPERYIKTKREAESSIATNFPKMRSIFIRPPFLYDSSRTITMPLAAMTAAGATANWITGGIFSGFMGAAGTKPLKAEVVAQAVVEALEDGSVKGVQEVSDIETLAEKNWRREML